MSTPHFTNRRSATLALIALLGFGAPLSLSAAPFQPLNEPAVTAHRPGKFIWADLFTTDPEAAKKFYSGLFGWTAKTVMQEGKSYTVFSNGSQPVAGLAPRPSSNSKRPSRWISYIAVDDIHATLGLVKKASGQVRAEAREFPDRGTQAIIADNNGATVGVLQSSSGDSDDDEPKPGDWNWFELYVKDPRIVAGFYHEIFGYEIAPDLRTERKNDFILSSGGLARAGVAPLPIRDDAQSGWLGVVRVTNLDEALKRTVTLGGEVLLAARPVAYESRFAIVADSTGGSIGLVEYLDNTNPANRP
jgi:predicted enzyme related to lactoylglutathione lyase